MDRDQVEAALEGLDQRIAALASRLDDLRATAEWLAEEAGTLVAEIGEATEEASAVSAECGDAMTAALALLDDFEEGE